MPRKKSSRGTPGITTHRKVHKTPITKVSYPKQINLSVVKVPIDDVDTRNVKPYLLKTLTGRQLIYAVIKMLKGNPSDWVVWKALKKIGIKPPERRTIRYYMKYPSVRKPGPKGPNKISKKMQQKIKKYRGTRTRSVRWLSRKFDISIGAVSKIFKSAGLRAYVIPETFSVSEKQIENRLAWATKILEDPIMCTTVFWDKVLITDEKHWVLSDLRNRQNNRERAWSRDEVVQRIKRKQYPKKYMCWCGMTSKGLTKLIWMDGVDSVGASEYQDLVLDGCVAWLGARTREDGPIDKRKLFDDNDDWIFEQDHARSHASNLVERWLQEHSDLVPAYFRTLARHKNHAWYVPSKMPDVWPIERLWAIMTCKVYKNGAPRNKEKFKSEIEKCWKSFTPSTLTKLVHEIPARLWEIQQNKGKPLVTSGWKPRMDNPHICTCDVCH